MSRTQQHPLPITALIANRMKALGLSRTDLFRRAGYANITKGLRKLEQLCEGEFRTTQGLLRALPAVLEVPADVVKQAVEDTKRHFEGEEEAAYRESFVPHAVILTDRNKPQPVFVAALIGVDQLIRVDFDLSADPATFVAQALKGMQEKVARWKSASLPAFGRPTGVIVNYTPDRAVEFDLEGKPVAELDAAYRPGTASLSIKGRAAPMSQGEMAVAFGARPT